MTNISFEQKVDALREDIYTASRSGFVLSDEFEKNFETVYLRESPADVELIDRFYYNIERMPFEEIPSGRFIIYSKTLVKKS